MNDERNRLIRLIHVARRDLGMSEDEWRSMLTERFGVASSARLTPRQLEALLGHLKNCGFKVRHKGGKPRKERPSRALAQGATDMKIRALWLFLHEIGVVRDPRESALAAYVKRMTGVDALQWIDDEQSFRAIEALKKWGMRHLPGKVMALERAVLALKSQEAGDRSIEIAAQLDEIQGALFQRRHNYDYMARAFLALTELLARYEEKERG
uniref:Mu-like prophage protein gp16 n=1 Tax=Candidatus Kentrum sp. LFY TaxID=2126342 RepID=A0A450WGP5_9GAMM|nr:MAG: Mu-like prophage protein gp16 [Candidatus Kentron sp. LFY]